MDAMEKIVVFKLHNNSFGVPINFVSEIINSAIIRNTKYA